MSARTTATWPGAAGGRPLTRSRGREVRKAPDLAAARPHPQRGRLGRFGGGAGVVHRPGHPVDPPRRREMGARAALVPPYPARLGRPPPVRAGQRRPGRPLRLRRPPPRPAGRLAQRGARVESVCEREREKVCEHSSGCFGGCPLVFIHTPSTFLALPCPRLSRPPLPKTPRPRKKRSARVTPR